jgi:hypothetical protein
MAYQEFNRITIPISGNEKGVRIVIELDPKKSYRDQFRARASFEDKPNTHGWGRNQQEAIGNLMMRLAVYDDKPGDPPPSNHSYTQHTEGN